jgi:sulfur carrier protein ThiS
MKIEVKLYSTLTRYLSDDIRGQKQIMEVKEGTTVNELLQQLGVPADAVKLIFLDGLHSDGDSVLKDGIRLTVFPPVGGG